MYRGKYSNLIKEVKQKTQKNLNNNFWKWFGNSKMKKKNGDPIVFYHTTIYDFNVFEPIIWDKNNIKIDYENGRQQYYFSKNEKWSKQFGKEEFSKRKKKKTLAVFLKIENPIVINHDNDLTLDEWIKYFNKKGVNFDKEKLQRTVRNTFHFDQNTKQWEQGFKGNFWELIYRDKHYFKDILNNAGYDGIIYRDTYRGGYPQLAVVVFNSNQIKSIDNNGEWNTNSNNIYEYFIKDYSGTPIIYYTISNTELSQNLVNESAKQSNLNDNFWKWFNNSKVVNENGNPLVVIHRTKSDFNTFDITKSHPMNLQGKGFYFSSKDDLFMKNSFGNKIMKCYLSIQNPFYGYQVKYKKSILKKYISNEDLQKIFEGNNSETFEGYELFFGLQMSRAERNVKGYDTIDTTAILKNLGFDGIYLSENNVWVAFEPNQIKSIDNNGEWNSKSNNIYETYDYIDDTEVLLNPTKKEFNDFVIKNKWYRILLSKTGFAIWSADTPLLHMYVEDEYDVKNATHLFAYNGNVYFQDYNLIPEDFDNDMKEWFIKQAKELDNNKILKSYFPKIHMEQETINMFNGKKIIESLNENKLSEVQEDIKYILSSDTVLFSCDPSTYDFMLKCLKQGQKPEYFYFNFYKNRPTFMNLCRSLLYRFTGNKIKGTDELIKKKISSYDGYSISKEAIKVILNGYYGKIKVGI